MKHKLSIIIPCYNEKNTVEKIISTVQNVALPEGWDREIIIVDDGSTDGTREILRTHTESLRVLFNAKNLGKGGAVKEGLKVASGDFIIFQDADLEYDPEDYKRLIAPLGKGKTEIVIGSRSLGHNNVPVSFIYYHGGQMLGKIYNVLFGSKFSDITSCYKLFPAKLIPKLLEQKNNDFVFDAVQLTCVLLENGMDTITEIPIAYHARNSKEGKKLNWKHGVKVLLEMFRLRFFK